MLSRKGKLPRYFSRKNEGNLRGFNTGIYSLPLNIGKDSLTLKGGAVFWVIANEI
jgi:hypothetical protein